MTKRRLSAAVTAAVAAGALAGGLFAGTASAGTTGTATSAKAASAKAAECQPGTLKAVVEKDDGRQHGMNHAGRYLRVTNTGKETCSFKGYPGLALEGKGHTALKTTAYHGDTYFAKDPGVRTVTLKPGKSAYANLDWTHSGADMARARYLQISPTGGNAHSTVPFKQDVDNGDLSVTAWSAKRPTSE